MGNLHQPVLALARKSSDGLLNVSLVPGGDTEVAPWCEQHKPKAQLMGTSTVPIQRWKNAAFTS